jgi:hypothetical protein
MTGMHWIGIDPGLSGGFGVLDDEGNLVAAGDLPVAGTDAQRRIDGANLAAILRLYSPARCAIEQVSAMPGQGVSSTFRFGQATGTVAGVVAALGIPVEWVAPSRWKRSFGLSADKEPSRLRAIETWPASAHLFARKKDHGRAEGALLALWLRKNGNAAIAA